MSRYSKKREDWLLYNNGYDQGFDDASLNGHLQPQELSSTPAAWTEGYIDGVGDYLDEYNTVPGSVHD